MRTPPDSPEIMRSDVLSSPPMLLDLSLTMEEEEEGDERGDREEEETEEETPPRSVRPAPTPPTVPEPPPMSANFPEESDRILCRQCHVYSHPIEHCICNRCYRNYQWYKKIPFTTRAMWSKR